MKVVFLDFDGVLNSQAWRDKQVAARGMGWDQTNWVNNIDPQAVRRLNGLTWATGARVVISSSWRIVCSVEEIQAWLDACGAQFSVIGRTPGSGETKQILARDAGTMYHGGRGDEIDAWLRCWNRGEPYSKIFWPKVGELGAVDSFVILDDSSDMDPWMDRLVRTEWETGLVDDDVHKAAHLLTRPYDTLVAA